MAAVLIGIVVLKTQLYTKRPAPGPLPHPAVILRRGNGPEPESLDLHQARSEAALTVLRDLYEGLTAVGAGGDAVLAGADQYTVSPDAKTYDFHLRSAGHWSNGDPVVPADFVAAWRRLIDPRTGAQYSQLLLPVRHAADIAQGRAPPDELGVRAIDDATLEVELERPTPYFLSLLSHPATFPIHRASLAAHGRGFAKPGVMVSNGAFVLTRWDFGSHLIAARNRHYWNDAATRLDGVEFYSITDQAGEYAAFRSGALDITSTIPAAQFAWIKQHLADELQVTPQLAVYFLGFNLRRSPFANAPALRRALSMAIDRAQLVDSITGGGEVAADTFVPPQTLGYSPPQPEYAAWSMAKRIATARDLVAAAHLAPSAPIELRYNTSELNNRIAVAVASMWKNELGIDVSLHAEEFKVLLQDIDRGDVTQLFRASWLADYDDAFSFLQVMQSGFGINLPRYSNPAYDDLLQRASNQADAGARRALLQQAEHTLLDDQPLIPLYFFVSKHLVSSRVAGWQNNVMNVVYSKSLGKSPAAN